jgi:hypothetical protein
LRGGSAGVEDGNGHGNGHNQAGDDHGCLSGKAARACFRMIFSENRIPLFGIMRRSNPNIGAFYDSCRVLTTRRLGQQRGVAPREPLD